MHFLQKWLLLHNKWYTIFVDMLKEKKQEFLQTCRQTLNILYSFCLKHIKWKKRHNPHVTVRGWIYSGLYHTTGTKVNGLVFVFMKLCSILVPLCTIQNSTCSTSHLNNSADISCFMDHHLHKRLTDPKQGSMNTQRNNHFYHVTINNLPTSYTTLSPKSMTNIRPE